MKITNAITLNAKAGLAAAFFALPLMASVPAANAQTEQGRDAAIQNCIAVAQRQFPDSDTQSSARVSVYKACMTSAGHRP